MVQRLGSSLVKHAGVTLKDYLDGLDSASRYIYITPEDFGAVGNGVVDDTTALQACIDAALAQGKPVYLPRWKIYMVSRTINIKEGVGVYGTNSARIKKLPGFVGDMVVMSHRSVLDAVILDGNKPAQALEGATCMLRIGDSDDVKVNKCTVFGSNSYGIVINTGRRATVTFNRIDDFYQQGIAVYSSLAEERHHVIEDNEFYNIGWGAISTSYLKKARIRRNKARGLLLGGRSKRMYLDAVGNRFTLRAGDNFADVREGNWVVIRGGGEFRITRKIDNTTLEVDRAPGDGTGLQALVGAGDLIGVQSGWNIDCDDNDMSGTTTFGFGGGTMDGSTAGMYYCNFRNNKVDGAGKNGFNLGQNGFQGVGNCVITGNTLRNVGQGGDSISDIDRAGINLHFGNAGYMANILLDNNTVESYSGDDKGQSNVWLYLSGSPTGGCVFLGNNYPMGTAADYILGDIISIALGSGWGSEAAFTSYTSFGNSVTVTISTAGVSQSSDPECAITKACTPVGYGAYVGKMVSSNIGFMNIWGEQLSTKGVWRFRPIGTPSAGGLMQFHMLAS